MGRPHYWTQGPFFQKKKLGCFSDVLPTCGLKHKTTRLLSNTEQYLTDAINDDVTHFIIPNLRFVGSSLIGVKKIFWHWYACVTHARYDPAIAASAKPSSKLKKGKKYQRTKNKKRLCCLK